MQANYKYFYITSSLVCECLMQYRYVSLPSLRENAIRHV